MMNISLTEIFAKMPVEELEQTMNEFLAPVTDLLPEKRLRRVVPDAVRGILAQETPVIAALAQSTPRQEMSCYAGRNASIGSCGINASRIISFSRAFIILPNGLWQKRIWTTW